MPNGQQAYRILDKLSNVLENQVFRNDPTVPIDKNTGSLSLINGQHIIIMTEWESEQAIQILQQYNHDIRTDRTNSQLTI